MIWNSSIPVHENDLLGSDGLLKVSILSLGKQSVQIEHVETHKQEHRDDWLQPPWTESDVHWFRIADREQMNVFIYLMNKIVNKPFHMQEIHTADEMKDSRDYFLVGKICRLAGD